MDTTEQFLQEIEAFLARTGMSQTAFGKRAMRDASFVTRLRAEGPGKRGNATLFTVDRVRDWIAKYEKQHTPASV